MTANSIQKPRLSFQPPFYSYMPAYRSDQVPPQRDTDELHGITVPEQKIAFPLMAQVQYGLF